MKHLKLFENFLEELADTILHHLQDNDIVASYEKTNDNNSITIEVGGEEYVIKREGNPPRFIMTTKHNEPETFTASDLISWWIAFVPQYKHDEAEYHRDGIKEELNSNINSEKSEKIREYLKTYPFQNDLTGKTRERINVTRQI